jgi:hypothetical protein
VPFQNNGLKPKNEMIPKGVIMIKENFISKALDVGVHGLNSFNEKHFHSPLPSIILQQQQKWRANALFFSPVSRVTKESTITICVGSGIFKVEFKITLQQKNLEP